MTDWRDERDEREYRQAIAEGRVVPAEVERDEMDAQVDEDSGLERRIHEVEALLKASLAAGNELEAQELDARLEVLVEMQVNRAYERNAEAEVAWEEDELAR